MFGVLYRAGLWHAKCSNIQLTDTLFGSIKIQCSTVKIQRDVFNIQLNAFNIQLNVFNIQLNAFNIQLNAFIIQRIQPIKFNLYTKYWKVRHKYNIKYRKTSRENIITVNTWLTIMADNSNPKCLNDASNLINTMLEKDSHTQKAALAMPQTVTRSNRNREVVNVPSVRASINSAVDRARSMIGESSSRDLCLRLNRRERLRATSSKPSSAATKKPRLEEKVFEFLCFTLGILVKMILCYFWKVWLLFVGLLKYRQQQVKRTYERNFVKLFNSNFQWYLRRELINEELRSL